MVSSLAPDTPVLRGSNERVGQWGGGGCHAPKYLDEGIGKVPYLPGYGTRKVRYVMRAILSWYLSSADSSKLEIASISLGIFPMWLSSDSLDFPVTFPSGRKGFLIPLATAPNLRGLTLEASSSSSSRSETAWQHWDNITKRREHTRLSCRLSLRMLPASVLSTRTSPQRLYLSMHRALIPTWNGESCAKSTSF